MASFVETQGHGGDEGDFEALYSTYWHEVQRLASSLLRNATDAEDASQTVFVNVLRALRQGVQPADPRAWLLAITRNVCFSRRRAAAARPDEVELDPERVPEPDGNDGPTVEEIVGALARMLPNQRTALILRDFRGAPHNEICELLSLSPAGAETLLTRARVSFREEIEAGTQPFDSDETKTLVEQQLAGLITTAERHSLRTHLRHCSPCATLARALRSSRAKAAGVLFWPVELFSRLAGALSQAPTAAHVAAALTSSAAIATVAIPVAVSNAPASNHVEGRTAPALVAGARAAPSASPAPAAPLSRAPTRQSAHPGVAPVSHAAPVHVHRHVRSSTVHGRVTRKHEPSRAAHVQAAAVHAPSTSRPVVTTSASGPQAEIASSSQQDSSHAAAPSPPLVRVGPAAVPPRSLPAAVPPRSLPAAVPPRSPASGIRPRAMPPASRPRPKARPRLRPRFVRHFPVRRGGHYPPDPASVMPALSQVQPASTPGTGTASGPGQGVAVGASSSTPAPASSSSAHRSGSSGGSGNGGSNIGPNANPGPNASGSNGGDTADGSGNGSGHGDKHRH